MIHKPFETIVKSDIDELIENQIPEGRTIEYKQALPGGADGDKHEFLADVSSFANTVGGDLIYGVRAEAGVPVEGIGIDCTPDDEILKMENLIRDGLDPRITGVMIKPIVDFPQGPVLFIRIPKSWAYPHMVKLRGSSKFYIRTSAGKHKMDCSEIRSAFLLSETIMKKVKRFRDERLGRIITEETPIPLAKAPKCIIHVLPLISFDAGFGIHIDDLQAHDELLRPIRPGSWGYRLNLDGFLTFSGELAEGRFKSYCQIFRSAQIESVDAGLTYDERGVRMIRSVSTEEKILKAVFMYFSALKALDIQGTLLVFINLIDVRNARLGLGPEYEENPPYPIDRDILTLPEILVEDYSALTTENDVAKALRPAFDAIWNAVGLPKSLNFDAEGNWRPHNGI